MQNQLTFISKVSSTALNMEITKVTSKRAARRRSMLVEVAMDEEVIWYMSKLMKRICNERLKI